jgi:hypothetical protein
MCESLNTAISCRLGSSSESEPRSTVGSYLTCVPGRPLLDTVLRLSNPWRFLCLTLTNAGQINVPRNLRGNLSSTRPALTLLAQILVSYVLFHFFQKRIHKVFHIQYPSQPWLQACRPRYSRAPARIALTTYSIVHGTPRQCISDNAIRASFAESVSAIAIIHAIITCVHIQSLLIICIDPTAVYFQILLHWGLHSFQGTALVDLESYVFFSVLCYT